MASEDSDQLGSRFLAVHRLGDLEKIRKSMPGEVLTVSHPLHDEREFLKVVALGRSQRMCPEERDHNAKQVSAPKDVERVQMLTMVAITSVSVHRSDPKKSHRSRRQIELVAPCLTTNSCVI
jgi:hypothetical protein